ncbi:hypothetical protein [Candidatus Neomicrothrix sp.]|uniref:hypothetical protein n=1 Tax=Candidatus Neomicrothrix sp. TaxID=2719034 RepID=UPI0025BE14DF|nr:hypothetical protein [Candidatus Microthrix sp.]
MPGADTTNGRVETAEALMPAAPRPLTTQPGIPDEITDWEDVRLVMPTLGEDVRVVEGVDWARFSEELAIGQALRNPARPATW